MTVVEKRYKFLFRLLNGHTIIHFSLSFLPVIDIAQYTVANHGYVSKCIA
jgi:hypothetical protein